MATRVDPDARLACEDSAKTDGADARAQVQRDMQSHMCTRHLFTCPRQVRVRAWWLASVPIDTNACPGCVHTASCLSSRCVTLPAISRACASHAINTFSPFRCTTPCLVPAFRRATARPVQMRPLLFLAPRPACASRGTPGRRAGRVRPAPTRSRPGARRAQRAPHSRAPPQRPRL